jgi:hypothetical protein
MQRTRWIAAIMVMALSVVPALANGDFYVIAGGAGVGTKITSLPYTISQPGFYYLTKNLDYDGTGSAITVSKSNVTIDLMGFCLRSLQANPGTKGISMGATGEVRNVEVRIGTLWNFAGGIYAGSTSGISLPAVSPLLK